MASTIATRAFAGVLFDLDSTLIDSVHAVARSWRRWADEHGVEHERLLGFHGVPASGIIDALVQPEQRAAALGRVNAIELADTEGITALPGARRALAALPAHRFGIATSCTMPLALARLAAAGLDAPHVLVTADQVTRGKPHPDPFLLGARRLGVEPGDCLVVEDAPAGLAAARAAGCATLAVRTTHPDGGLDADLEVATLDDVVFVSADDGVRVRLATDDAGPA